MWVTTDLGGTYRYDYESKKYEYFLTVKDDSCSISHPFISRIKEDRSGNYWLASYWNGLNVWNPDTGCFKKILYDPKNPKGLPKATIIDFEIDQHGILWLAMQDAGLVKYDPDEGTFMQMGLKYPHLYGHVSDLSLIHI